MGNDRKQMISQNLFIQIKSFLKCFFTRQRISRFIYVIIKESFFALLTAAVVFFASVLYHNWVEKTQQNDLLNRVYISVSDEYVESLFGIPYISVNDENNLENNYYIITDAVLRTVSFDDSVVAFFITSTSNKKINVESCSSETITLCRDTYSDINFPNPSVSALCSTSAPINFYCESQGTGRYGMYNNYVFATLPYGYIMNKNDKSLITSANTTINLLSSTDILYDQEVNKLRSMVAPNTFGVIASGYEEKVSVIPNSNWWNNVYYMIIRTS